MIRTDAACLCGRRNRSRITELAAALSVPTVYLEPIVRRLTDGELMRRTDSSRYATDFVLLRPEDYRGRFDAQLAFVREHFGGILGRSGGSARGNQRGGVLPRAPAFGADASWALRPPLNAAKLSASLFGRTGRVSQAAGRRELDCDGTCVPRRLHRDRRRQKSERVCRAWRTPNVGRRLRLRRRVVSQLCEFDTTLWDNPCRFAACGYDVYFREMPQLLWRLHKGLPLDGVSNTMLECLDELITVGLLTRETALQTDVPCCRRRNTRRQRPPSTAPAAGWRKYWGRRIGRI